MRQDSALRVCTECGKSLAGHAPNKVTCSASCRSARSRRKKRKQESLTAARVKANARTPGAQALYELTGKEHEPSKIEDIARDVMRETLAPVVREALTEDVLRAVQNLVGLTPLAVAAIMEDIVGRPAYTPDGDPILDSEGNHVLEVDPKVRQAAYTLLMRYTVGHGALLQQEDPKAGGLTVVFPGMPRPSAIDIPAPAEISGPSSTEPEDAEVVESTLICNACDTEKPRSEFVGKSDRCKECHAKLVTKARALEETVAEGTGS